MTNKRIFFVVLVYHAPVKQKVVRGNQAPFMTKDLTRYDKSKATKWYAKWPSRENYLVLKKAKSKCTSIKKAKKTN